MPPEKKWPALHLYTGDYRKDPGVQTLDYWDHGVWLNLLFLMHESEERGKLVLNGTPMTDVQIARVLGLPLTGQESYEDGVFQRPFGVTLKTLLNLGVACRDERGALCNRRMVRDELKRQLASEAGKRGGSPLLRGHGGQNGGPPQPEAPPPRPEEQQVLPDGGILKGDRRPPSDARGTRLPEDWQIDAGLAAWIREHYAGVSKRDVDKVHRQFVNYWTAIPGVRGRKLNWDRTFQNWFDREMEKRGKGGGDGRKDGRVGPGDLDED
jgi:hypothetical protein